MAKGKNNRSMNKKTALSTTPSAENKTSDTELSPTRETDAESEVLRAGQTTPSQPDHGQHGSAFAWTDAM